MLIIYVATFRQQLTHNHALYRHVSMESMDVFIWITVQFRTLYLFVVIYKCFDYMYISLWIQVLPEKVLAPLPAKSYPTYFLRKYLDPRGVSIYIYMHLTFAYIFACIITFTSYYLCDIAWHGIILNYIKLYYITEFGMRKAARRSPCPQGRPPGPRPSRISHESPMNIWMIWGLPSGNLT
jgi:hypothetical protein